MGDALANAVAAQQQQIAEMTQAFQQLQAQAHADRAAAAAATQAAQDARAAARSARDAAANMNAGGAHVHAPARVMPDLRPPKPRSFHGRFKTDGVSAREWVGSLKRYLGLAPNLPESEQVTYAAALLQGEAYSWWMNMEASGRATQLVT